MSKDETMLLKHILLNQALIMQYLAFNNAMFGATMEKAAEDNIKLVKELEREVADELRKD